MKRILIAVAALGVAAAIAVGTQRSLPRASSEERTDASSVTRSALEPRPGVASADQAQQDPSAGALDPNTPVTSGGTIGGPPSSGTSAGAGVSAPSAGAAESAHAGDHATSPADAAEPASGTSSQQTTSQRASAQDILERAAAAYADVRSMQANFAMSMTNPLLRRTTNSRGVLYQRRPDRLALRFSDPAGDVIVSDGRYFWIYYPSVDEDQVIRMPASQRSAGGVDLQAQFVGDPTERFDATLHGTETVGGREAYVLTLDPRTPAAYSTLKVWLDTQDYLARRFEIVEESGAVRRFDLSGLRTNLDLPDATFRFTPPAGAQIVDRS